MTMNNLCVTTADPADNVFFYFSTVKKKESIRVTIAPLDLIQFR